MGDLIKSLHSLSNNEEQEYKFSVKFKDGKAICILGKNKEDRNLVLSGPVQEVSDNIESKFRKFLKITEDAGDELQDNLEEVEEEVKEEEGKEEKAAADKAAKAAKTGKGKTVKEEPARKAEPVKTALDTVLEKLDKATKTTVTKAIDRIHKGSTDPDVMNFLKDNFTKLLTPVIDDPALIAKALEEVLMNVPKKEEPKAEDGGMFNTAADPAPAPVPVVKADEPKKAAPAPAAPVAQQPVVQPASLDIDDGDLF